MWFISFVDLGVSLEIVISAESSLAELAGKRAIVGMRARVTLEIIQASKGLAAPGEKARIDHLGLVVHSGCDRVG